MRKYYLKKLYSFYNTYSFLNKYEKFFLCIQQRILLIVKRLQYLSKYQENIKRYRNYIKYGFILINLINVKSFYFIVLLLDLVSICYRIYCFEWWYYYELSLLFYKYKKNSPLWNGMQYKKKLLNFSPYILNFKRKIKM
jgi:hypothetical protein